MHITIVGGVRRVEFYPTGTVYANAEKGKFPAFKQKKPIKVAIRLAKSGA
jgi:hypothetical protein